MHAHLIRRVGFEERRRARRLVLLGLAVLAAGVLATTAGAQRAFGPPPGGPLLDGMALAVGDFPAGAKVGYQGYVKPDKSLGVAAEYDRAFKPLSVRLGTRRLVAVESDVVLLGSVGDANTFTFAFRLFLSALEPRDVKAVVAPLKTTYVKIGNPFGLRAGDASAAARARIGTRAGEVQAVFAVVQVGRVAVPFYFVGAPRAALGTADAVRLGRIIVAHTRRGLVPSNTASPKVSGDPHVGQTLTAAPGTWRNAPKAFAYTWSRCDLTASGCTAIPGATGRTYVPGADDAGSTIVVTVRAANAYGSASGTSGATPAVSVAGAPASTAPPTISGTAAQGQTLTAAAGTWSGEPTALAYQWRRCTAKGTGCLDVDGATDSTYAVTAADSGFRLRVVVTATNAAGPGVAISAATGPVA
jgi:hypothetical protein